MGSYYLNPPKNAQRLLLSFFSQCALPAPGLYAWNRECRACFHFFSFIFTQLFDTTHGIGSQCFQWSKTALCQFKKIFSRQIFSPLKRQAFGAHPGRIQKGAHIVDPLFRSNITYHEPAMALRTCHYEHSVRTIRKNLQGIRGFYFAGTRQGGKKCTEPRCGLSPFKHFRGGRYGITTINHYDPQRIPCFIRNLNARLLFQCLAPINKFRNYSG